MCVRSRRDGIALNSTFCPTNLASKFHNRPRPGECLFRPISTHTHTQCVLLENGGPDPMYTQCSRCGANPGMDDIRRMTSVYQFALLLHRHQPIGSNHNKEEEEIVKERLYSRRVCGFSLINGQVQPYLIFQFGRARRRKCRGSSSVYNESKKKKRERYEHEH